jgi:hypothetical protein
VVVVKGGGLRAGVTAVLSALPFAPVRSSMAHATLPPPPPFAALRCCPAPRRPPGPLAALWPHCGPE